jgi:hypothetical protein
MRGVSEMVFTLKIVFTGLIAFVPIKDGEVMLGDPTPSAQPDEVWVLLVDARNPRPATDRKGLKFHSHHAVLRPVDPGVVSGRELTDGKYLPIPDESFELVPGEESAKVELTLVTGTRVQRMPCCTQDADPDCGTVHKEDPAEKDCVGKPGASRVGDQMRDFNWLASFREIRQGTTMEPSLWKEVVPPEGRIVGRLKIAMGELSTYMIQDNGVPPEPWSTNEQFKQSSLMEFDPSDGLSWKPRGIAKKMVLEIKGLRSNVTLTSRSLTGSAKPQPVVLTPRLCAVGQDCEVVIHWMNSPLFEVKGDSDPMKNGSRRHFELLWNLLPLDSWPKDGERPAPSPIPPPPFVSDLLCPEVRP